MNSDTARATGIVGLCTVRLLDTQQIRKLMRVRGADKSIAGAAFAAGMTIARFKKLPPEQQRIVQQAYTALIAADSIAARPEKPGKPSLRDFSEEERVALGGRLLAVKARLPHGHFGIWCDEKSGLKRNTIRVCMKMTKAAAPDRTR